MPAKKNSPGQRPTGVLDPVHGLLLCRSLTFVLPRDPLDPVLGLLMLARIGSRVPFPNGTPFGPQKEIDRLSGDPPVRLLCA